MQVDLSKLPSSILDQIPRSIKSYKSVYDDINELPAPIQYLIRDYFDKQKTIKYGTVFDIFPDISAYGDFKTLDNVQDTVVEYLKNFFLTLIGDYPFDAVLGTKLKKYLHARDTDSSKQLIEAEVQMILQVISADLNVNVTLDSVSIIPVSEGAYTEYNIRIAINLNGNNKAINLTVLGG